MQDQMPQAATADNSACNSTADSTDAAAPANAAAANETTASAPDQPAVEHPALLEGPAHQPTEAAALEFEQAEDEFDPALTALAPAADADDRQTGAVTSGVPAVATPALSAPPTPQPADTPTIEFELNENEFDAAMNAMAPSGKAKRRQMGRYQDKHDLNCAVEGDHVRLTVSDGELTWQTKIRAHAIGLMTDLTSFSTSFDRILALATVDLVRAYNRRAQRATTPGVTRKQTHESYFEKGFGAMLVRIGELPEAFPKPQPQPEKPAENRASRIHFAFYQETGELKVTAGAAKLRIVAAEASPHAALALANGGTRWFDADVAEKLALALEYVRSFAEENSGQIVPRTVSVTDGSVRGGSHLAVTRARADGLRGLAFDIPADTAKSLARIIAKQAGFRFATDGNYAVFEGPTVAIAVPLAAQAFAAVNAIFSEHTAKGSCASVSPNALASAIATVESVARPRIPAPGVMIHLSWCQKEDQKAMMVESVEPAGIGRTAVDLRAYSGETLEKEPSARSRAKQIKRAMRGMYSDRWFDLTLSDGAVMFGFDVEGLEVQHALSYGDYDGPGPIRPLPADYLDRIFNCRTNSEMHQSGASAGSIEEVEHKAADATADDAEPGASAPVTALVGSAEESLSTARAGSGPGPIRPLPADYLDRIFSTEHGPDSHSDQVEHAERESGSQLASPAAPVAGVPDTPEVLVADLAGDGEALEGMGAEPAIDAAVLGMMIDGPAAEDLNADCAAAGADSWALDHPIAYPEVAAPNGVDLAINKADGIKAGDGVANEDAAQLCDEAPGKHGGAATIDADGSGSS